MNSKLLLFGICALTIVSCSTAYKNTQTPDDVYFSPLRPIGSDEVKNEEKDQADDPVISENREIRMKAYDRRWRDMDRDYDYDYSYHPYKYGYTYGYYYNPYYYNYPIYMPGIKYSNPKNTSIRMTNLGAYSTISTSTVNPKTGKTEYKSGRIYNNNNNGIIRRIFTGNTSSDNNSRTYSPSTNSRSSSSGSTSSGSGQSISRPAKKN